MTRVLSLAVVFGIAMSWTASPAFAIKPFNDQFKATYSKNNENKEFVKLMEEAKCNLCHIEGAKKEKRNEFGEAVATLLKKKEFDAERLKKEPEKCKEEMEKAFKKAEEMKAKDGMTFGEKIKAGKLPGGDVKGK